MAIRAADWAASSFPWPNAAGAGSQVPTNQSISELTEAQQESQFKADVLGLRSDTAKYVKHLHQAQANDKSRKIATAAHVREQVHIGRSQVVEPYVNKTCRIGSCETVSGVVQQASRFITECAGQAGMNGTCARVFFADCNRFGRMSDDTLNNLFEAMQGVLAMDPANSCGFVLCTTVLSKKRLQGLYIYIFLFQNNYMQFKDVINVVK